MSIASLTDMRRARLRPAGVKVVLGTTHSWVKEWSDYIVIEPADVPELLDLRALVGLPVTVVEIEQDDAKFGRVVEALQAAHAHIEGIVSVLGPCGRNEEHEEILMRLRNRLCI